jgi:hypothetical protein
MSTKINVVLNSVREELATSINSGVGFVFAVAGSIVLVARAGSYGTVYCAKTHSLQAATLSTCNG